MNKKIVLLTALVLFVGLGIYSLGKKYAEAPVIVQNENHSQDTTIPTEKIPPQKTLVVQLFFANSITDPTQMDCTIIPSLSRTIPYTTATARTSIEELIKGPTKGESLKGFRSQIDMRTKLNSILIKDGVAYVDFSKELTEKNPGLCGGQIIETQIKRTLMQFPSIRNVVITVEGETLTIEP